MPGRKKSSTAKAKSERRAVLQKAKHRKLANAAGEVITGRAAFDLALRAGGQEPNSAVRKRKITAGAGKHKRKPEAFQGLDPRQPGNQDAQAGEAPGHGLSLAGDCVQEYRGAPGGS